jgi:hypothetical protein
MQNMKMQILVMPAWMAGIHGSQDASGDIHVGLGSSTPCWNDAIGGVLLKPTEAPSSRIFKRRRSEEGIFGVGFESRCMEPKGRSVDGRKR